MDLELSTFDLPGALSNAMTLVRERAQRHGIELSLEVDRRLGAFQADERKFKQIVLNLLSNAVKFTPDGGRVDVSAKRDDGMRRGRGAATPASASRRRTRPRCSRNSSRSGATTPARPKARGSASRSPSASSSCTAARSACESALGKGSTFTVTLPPGSERPMSTVLIVEDNEKNMKLARDVLQVKGYQTLEAVTGEEGVKLAQGEEARPRADGHPAAGHQRHRGLQADPRPMPRRARFPSSPLTASVTPTTAARSPRPASTPSSASRSTSRSSSRP